MSHGARRARGTVGRIAAVLLLAVSAPAPGNVQEAPSGRYVSKVRDNKAYKGHEPWSWEDLKAQSIESKNRPEPPWLKPAEGARHPIVLFDPAELPRIRARLKEGAGPRILAYLQRSAAEGSPAEAGLYSLLAEDPAPAKKAVPRLLREAARPSGSGLALGRQVQGLALGYDLLYPFMAVPEREKAREALDRFARDLFLAGFGHTNGNWLGNNQVSLGIAGYALREENRYAESWILQARWAVSLYLHNTYDPEGADFEALSRYFAMGMDPTLVFCAAERRQGRDWFDYRGGLFNGIVEFSAYMLLPTRRAWVPFDDAFLKDVDCPATFAAIAGLIRDPLAQGIFDAVYRAPQTWVGNGLLAAAYYDPSVPVEKPEESKRLPLGRAWWGFSGEREGESSSGHVFLRTGFDRREDILFAAQCGDTGGWHGHADQSSIYLHAYGDVLVQDPAIIGDYETPLCEWMKGSEAHSLVLVDGESSPHYTVGDRLNWPIRYFKGGEVDGFVHTPTLDFVSMDFRRGLALNPKLKAAERANRTALFFRLPDRQGYFVIVDEVVKDAAPRRYDWLLQPDEEHKAVKRGPGHFAFTGRVDLEIRMIEPANPDHSVDTYPGYPAGYLRVRSRENRPRGLFLTVLYPRKKEMALPEIAEVRQGGAIGVRIGEDLVLFGTAPGGGVRAAGVETDGRLAALRISGGTVRNAVVVGGSSLSRNGTPVAFVRPEPRRRPR